MKLQLLPSTFNDKGCASPRQHFSCFVVDDQVAFDAGSLAIASTPRQKEMIRDVVLTHAHLDHIAGLPLFIDDLFASLKQPVRVHATQAVIDVVEQNIFNWSIYPRFSELKNENGAVLEYRPFAIEEDFEVRHLKIKPVGVNHKVPSVGFVVSDGQATFAFSGDTAEMDRFWEVVNDQPQMSAVLIECAFPDELEELAGISHHLTPRTLKRELGKLRRECPVYAINIKPMYYQEIIRQLGEAEINNLHVFEVGRIYEW